MPPMPNYWDREPRQRRPWGVVVIILAILIALDVTLSFCSSKAGAPRYPKIGIHASFR